jgi:hypothetical protein
LFSDLLLLFLFQEDKQTNVFNAYSTKRIVCALLLHDYYHVHPPFLNIKHLRGFNSQNVLYLETGVVKCNDMLWWRSTIMLIRLVTRVSKFNIFIWTSLKGICMCTIILY